jgi:N-acetylmuramoyl-L-alanine amidase
MTAPLSLVSALVVGSSVLTAGVAAPAAEPVAPPAAAASAPAVPAATAPVELQVDVIEREQWGAVGGLGARLGTVDEVVIHHFWRPSLPEVAAPERESAMMRQVEKTHVEENGWAGFGYNFVVFQSGRVYEGRGWGREGAHTTGKNDSTVGITFAIDGDTDAPTPEAWAAAKALIEDGVALDHLSTEPTISGHRDYAPKSCPGESIAPYLDRLAPDPA